MVQLNFNAAEVAPSQGFQVYPSGPYDVMINNSEMKQTKAKLAGTVQRGAYIQFNLKIASGEHAGGTLIARVNFENDNPTAEEIGQAELSAICRVCGVMQLQDTQQLHGIPFKIVVAKTERNDKPGAYGNEIKSYMDINGNDPDKAGQGVQQAAPPAPAAAPTTPPQTAPAPAAAAAPPAGAPPWNAQAAPATAPPVETAPAAQPPAETPPQPQATQPAPVEGAAPAAAAPPWAQG